MRIESLKEVKNSKAFQLTQYLNCFCLDKTFNFRIFYMKTERKNIFKIRILSLQQAQKQSNINFMTLN